MLGLSRRLRDQAGFTLVEVVVAGAVFALAAGALLSVLVAGIRTAGFAKDRTLAKDLGRERLEEMRRLPYYVSFATFPRRTDLLDFYFPDVQATSVNPLGPAGYDSTTKSYTISIDPVSGFTRYRMEIVSRFVDQNLATVTPLADYDWGTEGKDRPPSRLLATEVKLFWGPLAQSNFVLRSFLGEPRLGDLVVGGSVGGSIVRIDSAFSDFSTLLAEAGLGSSSIYVGNVTSARNDTTAARARVTASDGTVTEIVGAQQLAGAPPDTGPLTANDSGSSLNHPGLGLLAVSTIGNSQVSEVEAKVTADGPAAMGRLQLKQGADSDDVGQTGLTATNEVGLDARLLDVTKPFVSVVKRNSSLRPARLKTECATNPDDVSCRTDDGQTRELRLIPVTYGGSDIQNQNNTDGYLVTITFSELTVEAKASRLGAAGSPAATARFVGTLSYWRLEGDDDDDWEQVTVVLDSDDALSNALPDATARLNTCLQRDPIIGLCTVTLDDYIADWQALEAGTTSVSADGRTAQASLDGLVRITTKPTNLLLDNSGFLVNVGTLRAEAVDNR